LRATGNRTIARLRTAPLALTLLGLLLGSAPALASEPPFHITVLGGMSIANLRDAPDPQNVLQSLKGKSAGIGLGWSIGGPWELQPQLLYVEKGVSFGESVGTDVAGIPTGTFETLNVTGALEVPVLLRWNVPIGERVHPVLAVGPFASFEISERLKLTGSQDTSVDVNNLKGTDVGVTFGAGLEIDAGPGRWVIEGRYDSGTVDLNPDGSRSGAWLLMTGFRF